MRTVVVVVFVAVAQNVVHVAQKTQDGESVALVVFGGRKHFLRRSSQSDDCVVVVVVVADHRIVCSDGVLANDRSRSFGPEQRQTQIRVNVGEERIGRDRVVVVVNDDVVVNRTVAERVLFFLRMPRSMSLRRRKERRGGGIALTDRCATAYRRIRCWTTAASAHTAACSVVRAHGRV